MCARISQSDLAVIHLSKRVNYTWKQMGADPKHVPEPLFLKPPIDIKVGESFECAVGQQETSLFPDIFMTRMAWGYPLFDKILFNARIETAHQKPTWREAFYHARIIVPVNAWYERGYKIESDTQDGMLMPYMFLAGLALRHPNGKHSAVLLTVSANEQVAEVHNRMPLTLDPSHAQAWLNFAAFADEHMSRTENNWTLPTRNSSMPLIITKEKTSS